MEQKLQQPIKDYVEQKGSCTYDELVERFMPVKIHMGIDGALDTLLQARRLIEEDGCFRLPTPRETKTFRKEFLYKCGTEISFETLERIFALELEEEQVWVEFSLLEGGDFGLWKEENDLFGEMHYFFDSKGKNKTGFPTFEALADAPLFAGQSLRAVWEDAVVTSINDGMNIEWWIEEHLNE